MGCLQQAMTDSGDFEREPPRAETQDAAPLRDSLAALLRFYQAIGVDCALDEVAIDRFAAPPPAAPVFSPSLPQRPSVAPPVASPQARPLAAPYDKSPALAQPQEAAVFDARAAAAGAQTLDELRAALENFDGCALKFSATRLVFCDGAPEAKIMIVGEGPGRDEDLEGRPFVGRAGQLLDKMLAAIGLDRQKVYIANVVPWRPPGNRNPTPQELALCQPFIRRQIELVAPDFLILLGAVSAQSLLGEKDGILRLRGQWREYQDEGRIIRALPMLHPAFLLRSPLKKAQAWRDWRSLKHALEANDQN